MWLKIESFVDKIKQWWSSYRIHGTHSFILAGKMTALKIDLKFWNIQSFGDIGECKKVKLEEIQELKRIQEERVLCQEGLSRKTKLDW